MHGDLSQVEEHGIGHSGRANREQAGASVATQLNALLARSDWRKLTESEMALADMVETRSQWLGFRQTSNWATPNRHAVSTRVVDALTSATYNHMVVSLKSTSPAFVDFDRMFGALADHTRRDIVRRAIAADEGIVELASHYSMSFAAVQKHIAILERAGLVTKQRVARRKVVRTNLEQLRVVRRLLDQYEEMWLGRIERMTELILETKAKDQ